MIQSNRRLTIREFSEDLNISYGSINRSEHETSECKICSTCFDGRTKATAFVNFIGVGQSCRFRFQLFRKCHHGRWNLGLWLWSWDQGSEFSMEITQFSSRKRKCVNQDPTWRWWWLCLLTFMELCELSLYPGTLRWTLNIIRANYSI